MKPICKRLGHSIRDVERGACGRVPEPPPDFGSLLTARPQAPVFIGPHVTTLNSVFVILKLVVGSGEQNTVVMK